MQVKPRFAESVSCILLEYQSRGGRINYKKLHEFTNVGGAGIEPLDQRGAGRS